MKIKPTEAWCAVGPDGVIDIDLIRRGRAGAEGAAAQVKGQAWPRLAQHAGWRCVRVRISIADDGEAEAVELPDAPPPRPHGARQPVMAEAQPGYAMGRAMLRFSSGAKRVKEPA